MTGSYIVAWGNCNWVLSLASLAYGPNVDHPDSWRLLYLRGSSLGNLRAGGHVVQCWGGWFRRANPLALVCPYWLSFGCLYFFFHAFVMMESSCFLEDYFNERIFLFHRSSLPLLHACKLRDFLKPCFSKWAGQLSENYDQPLFHRANQLIPSGGWSQPFVRGWSQK